MAVKTRKKGLSREAKSARVEVLKQEVAEASMVIFTGLTGIPAMDITEFRKQLRKQGGRLRICKNNVLFRVFDQLEESEIAPLISGSTGLIILKQGDEMLLARTIYDFLREREEKFMPRGGFQYGMAVSVEQLRMLSKLPGREAVLAQFLGALSGPISNFIYILQAVPQQTVSVLKQISEKEPS
ncbi:MAG TPA: 50S ribosomal protein L10 [bacterium]|uniref:Large ribosomal subunit protein uL10 n=1 Tax=candidate division TA06 bacterium ADurb.Bin417 TaxID=1852828 RepID=A0A1V5MKS3_UNCT6|nr:MAG: 50S ribosomal protein L10 [candidate division TA06 bacterium ADurb.Bin417]HNQ35842.1 50S ribosomal protein L10 [bacterium]HNS48938.1 50S ribosomal protein L10 [bacterium]